MTMIWVFLFEISPERSHYCVDITMCCISSFESARNAASSAKSSSRTDNFVEPNRFPLGDVAEKLSLPKWYFILIPWPLSNLAWTVIGWRRHRTGSEQTSCLIRAGDPTWIALKIDELGRHTSGQNPQPYHKLSSSQQRFCSTGCLSLSLMRLSVLTRTASLLFLIDYENHSATLFSLFKFIFSKVFPAWEIRLKVR